MQEFESCKKSSNAVTHEYVFIFLLTNKNDKMMVKLLETLGCEVDAFLVRDRNHRQNEGKGVFC